MLLEPIRVLLALKMTPFDVTAPPRAIRRRVLAAQADSIMMEAVRVRLWSSHSPRHTHTAVPSLLPLPRFRLLYRRPSKSEGYFYCCACTVGLVGPVTDPVRSSTYLLSETVLFTLSHRPKLPISVLAGGRDSRTAGGRSGSFPSRGTRGRQSHLPGLDGGVRT